MYPDRIAVRKRNQQITYLELNNAANCLAHAILARRETGRDPVALLFPKGEQVIAAPLYGVPKVRWPFEPAVAAVNVWSYRVTGNGKLIKVPQSSQ